MVERIIVGIDGSGPSVAALHWALNEAVAVESSVTLLHVVAGRDATEGEPAMERAVDLASELPQGVHVRVAHGDPTRMAVIEANRGDLLVVGTHKTGYLRGRVTGTKSVIMAALARCTTVLVPEDTLGHRHGVVVGVSADPSCHPAIIEGAATAQRRREELYLVHAVPDTPEDSAAGRARLAAAVDLAALTARSLPIRRRLSHRRPADAVLDAARTASLLVIGPAQTDAEQPGVPGDVMLEVLLNLTSPVMVAR